MECAQLYGCPCPQREEITEQNLEYFISSAEEADLQELEKVYDNLICITANGRPLKPKTMGQKNIST